MVQWKNPLLLLVGLGVSNLGNWIYLIAINLLVIRLTGSPAAVAGLFVIRPITNMLINTWAGSVIDRVNKRILLIMVDCLRGAIIILIPFMTSIWQIYFLMFIVNIAGSFFGPTSTTLITKLVPAGKRKRFNSLYSMTSSGAFLLGPSFSGLLIMYTNINVSIFINAVTFFICAIMIYFLPNVDQPSHHSHQLSASLTSTLVNDWWKVIQYGKLAKYVMGVYLLFQTTMLIWFALDSQEVTYIKQMIHLSDQDYGLLVSMTGIGALLGSLVAVLVVNHVSLRMYIGIGMVVSGIGYLIFYLSESFFLAASGFIIIGFFSSFSNSGYTTFFQNNVPIDMMGRISSVATVIQGGIQVVFTLILGYTAELFSLGSMSISFSIFALLLSFSLYVMIFIPSKISYYLSE